MPPETALSQPHTPRAWPAALRLVILGVILVVPLILGWVSVRMGRDVNWDLRNYHLYNAYAFVTGRMDFDIAPAQLQTFYNPLPDLPFYWMYRNVASQTTGFLLGMIHGINLSLVFLIFLQVVNPPLTWRRVLLGVALLAVSGLAPGFLSELGNTMNDNLLSLFVLGPLLMLLAAGGTGAAGRRLPPLALVGLAGFVLGLGAGLKPTIAALALGMGIALPLMYDSWRPRWNALLVFGLAGAAGVLVSAGWWWWELWTRFGNPLFPYFNDIFKSPYIKPASYVDDHFLPRQIWEYFAWPVLFSLDSYRANPLKFTDLRFGILYLAALAWPFTAIWRRRAAKPIPQNPDDRLMFETRAGTFLLVFFLASFVLWMLQSSNYRYLIPLELLVPLCFLVLLERMLGRGAAFAGVALSAALLVAITFKPFNWIRLPWSDPYFSVDTSRFDASQPALVVMLGGSPTAYVIPAFPPSYRFVRPESNFIQEDSYKLSALIEDALQDHAGPVYVLYDTRDSRVDLDRSLEQLDLEFDPQECLPLQVNTRDALAVCEAQKPPDGPAP